jgi:formylglycine-generating enzyme required for sulfatase activity
VIRSGSWATESWFMRATLRLYLPTGDFRNDNLGVRCARDDSD